MEENDQPLFPVELDEVVVDKLTNRGHLLNLHIRYLQGQEEDNEYGIHSNRKSTASPYPAFELSTHSKIGIKELRKSVNQVLIGKFLLCRVIAPSFGLMTVNTLVDDPSGTVAVRLSVASYHFHPGYQIDLLDSGLPVGSFLAIKHPILLQVLHDGLTLNCDHSEDVIVLSPEMLEHVGGLLWEDQIPDVFRRRAIDIQMEVKIDEFMEQGHQHYRNRKYEAAIECYQRALYLCPNHLFLLDFRSSAYLKVGSYDKALTDTESILERRPDFLMAQYHKALALCGLRKYQDALLFLSQCIPDNKPNGLDPLRDRIVEMKVRLKEQIQGVFDIRLFVEREKYGEEFKAFTDCAEYVCPDIQIMFMEGKGRGLVATRDIAPGELLMACKAFSCFDPASCGPTNLGFGELSDRVKCFLSNRLEGVIALRLQEEASLANDLYAAYAGPELGFLSYESSLHPTIDSDRISEIIRYNARYPRYTSRLGVQLLKRIFISVTVQSSLINHSCMSNALLDVYREFTFVRSLKFIPRGQEITVPYFDLRSPYELRRSQMESLGFNCTCELCLLDSRESVRVRQERNRIQDMARHYLSLPEPSERDINTLIGLMNHLEELRPQSKFNFYLECFLYKLALYYGNKKRFEQALTICKKAYFMFRDSPLVNSTFLFLALIVVGCTMMKRTHEKNTWSRLLRRYVETHGQLEPALNDIKDMVLTQFGITT